MKHFILPLLFTFSIAVGNTQTPNNVPTSGNVGIGTTSPTKKLEVVGESELNGRVTMDSSLVVKDSAQFDNDVRVKKRFTVEQKSYFFDDAFMKKRLIVDDRGVFKEHLVVKQNFRLDGNARVFGNQKNDGRLIVDSLARFKYNAVVNENFRVDGNSRIKGNQKNDGRLVVDSLSRFKDKVVMEGDVLMKEIDTTSNMNNKYLLFTNGNGKVFKRDISFFTGSFQPPSLQPCAANGPGPIANPVWRNGTNKLFSCVRVGVGTSDPESSLDVAGETRTVSLMAGIPSSTPTTFTAFKQAGASGSLQLPVARIGSYAGQTEKERFTFYSDGALHINHEGTNNVLEISNPQRKLLQLQADGLLRAREIQVDIQSWPDYVFSQQYKLLPLEDIKEYIELNKHLPGVPSEQEVRENGVNLGEMNKILLEKVEEMTLHLIDQDETIKVQQKMLEKQQQQIDLLMQKIDSGVKEGGQ